MIEKLLTDPTTYGMVGLLLLAIYGLISGRVRTEKNHQEVIARYEAQLVTIVARYEAQLTELRKDRDEYRAMLIKTFDTADRALAVAQGHTKKRAPGGSPAANS